MPKKNNPGCNCCGCDRVAYDDFERTDSSSLGASWTEQSGDWSIVSGKLTIASPTALNVATIAATFDGLTTNRVSAVVQGTNDGDQVGVVIRYTDASNLTYCLLTFHNTTATMQVKRVSSGTTTSGPVDPVTAPPGAPITIGLCRVSDGVTTYTIASVDGETVSRLEDAGTAGSVAAGVIVGNTTGAVTWDNVEAFNVDNTKERCECSVCDNREYYINTFDAQHSFYTTGDYSALLAGGRLRYTALGTREIHKCYRLPNLDGLELSIKTKLHFAAFANITAGVALNGVPGSSALASCLLFPAGGVLRWSYFNGANPVSTGTVAVACNDGDTVELQVSDTSAGAGLFTLRFLHNGVIQHTANNVDLLGTHAIDTSPRYGVRSTSTNVANNVAEFDDLEFTLS